VALSLKMKNELGGKIVMMISKQVDKLFEEYRNLKGIKLIINGSGAKWYFWFTVAMLIPTYYFLFRCIMSWDFINLAYAFLFIVLGFSSHFLAVAKSNKYVKSDARFKDYREQMKLKWWAFSYESFHPEYRYEQIRSSLSGLESHIDDLISIYEADGTRLLETIWKPVVILGAMLFPLIGEYIGFRYNLTLNVKNQELEGISPEMVPSWTEATTWEGLVTFGLLIPSLIVSGLLVWFLVFLCEKLLLTKVDDRKGLIKLLRFIKMER